MEATFLQGVIVVLLVALVGVLLDVRNDLKSVKKHFDTIASELHEKINGIDRRLVAVETACKLKSCEESS